MTRKSPFPGMDPYLEAYWPDVHARLCSYVADGIQRQLPPDLRARIDEDVRLETEADEEDLAAFRMRGVRPDVSVTGPEQAAAAGATSTAVATEPDVAEPIREPVAAPPRRFVSIIDVRNGRMLITAIKILSPSNVRPGHYRDAYCRKVNDLRIAGANIVEINLLRSGLRSLIGDLTGPDLYRLAADRQPTYDVAMSKSWDEHEIDYYPIPIRERLPKIRIPLRPTDTAIVILDLQALIDQVYEGGAYDDIDYSTPLSPPLPREADQRWVDDVTAAHRAGDAPQ